MSLTLYLLRPDRRAQSHDVFCGRVLIRIDGRSLQMAQLCSGISSKTLARDLLQQLRAVLPAAPTSCDALESR